MMNICMMNCVQKQGSELAHSTVKGKQRSSLQLLKNFSPLFTQEFSRQRSKVPYLVYKWSHTSQMLTQPTKSKSCSLEAWAQDNTAQALAGLFLANPTEGFVLRPIPHGPGPAPGQSHPATGVYKPSHPPPFSGLFFLLGVWSACCGFQQSVWVGLGTEARVASKIEIYNSQSSNTKIRERRFVFLVLLTVAILICFVTQAKSTNSLIFLSDKKYWQCVYLKGHG